MHPFIRAAAVLALVGLSACQSSSEVPAGAPAARDAGIQLTLTDIEGRSLNLASLRGKVVIVDVWATWCPPCRRSLPGLAALSRHRPQDLVVVGLLSGDDPRNLVGFLKTTPIPYFVAKPDPRAAALFPASALPTVFILDKQGVIVDRVVGAVPESELLRRAERHL